ncbi:MAG: arginine--tRNA ligase [Nitrospirota bacterium]|nr:arginine--tRNA ligase [Nitrospirota bacterium]
MPEGIVQEQVTAAIADAVAEAKRKGLLHSSSPPVCTVEFPKREEWGDLSSSVAMTIAKMEKRPPREVADLIAKQLEESCPFVDQVEVAPPGFLNLTLRRDFWFSVLHEIEGKGETYGHSELVRGKRVLIEYVSANPTGPLHIGHGRGAALGDAMARVLRAAGYSVEREFYINDAGRQMNLLAASVYARYQEYHGLAVSFPEDGYQGAYIRTVAEHIAHTVGTQLLDLPLSEALERCKVMACEELLEAIKQDLLSFGVGFDSWYPETRLFSSGTIRETLETLKQRDLVFEKDGALWFRSSRFQDEKDRVVCKQDGDYTYLASDIAYHHDKLKRDFDQLINIWGADHHGYVPRMQGVMQAFGYSKDRLQVVLVQMVSLLRGGRKVEMSKRAGEFVTLREVVDEVGADAAKFFFLMRRPDSHLEFDLELAKKQSAENPVYYVQYAHARLASLFRVAQNRGILVPPAGDANLTVLVQPEEFRLIKHLSSFPGLVEGCAKALEPHRLTFYLQELAGHLHAFYYKHRVLPFREEGTTGPELDLGGMNADRVGVRAQESPSHELMTARLVLLRQVQTVIRNGLTLLGVTAPEQM